MEVPLLARMEDVVARVHPVRATMETCLPVSTVASSGAVRDTTRPTSVLSVLLDRTLRPIPTVPCALLVPKPTRVLLLEVLAVTTVTMASFKPPVGRHRARIVLREHILPVPINA